MPHLRKIYLLGRSYAWIGIAIGLCLIGPALATVMLEAEGLSRRGYRNAWALLIVGVVLVVLSCIPLLRRKPALEVTADHIAITPHNAESVVIDRRRLVSLQIEQGSKRLGPRRIRALVATSYGALPQRHKIDRLAVPVTWLIDALVDTTPDAQTPTEVKVTDETATDFGNAWVARSHTIAPFVVGPIALVILGLGGWLVWRELGDLGQGIPVGWENITIGAGFALLALLLLYVVTDLAMQLRGRPRVVITDTELRLFEQDRETVFQLSEIVGVRRDNLRTRHRWALLLDTRGGGEHVIHAGAMKPGRGALLRRIREAINPPA